MKDSSHDKTMQSIKEEAALWLLKLEDSPSDEKLKSDFQQWLDANKAHKSSFLRIAQTWQDMDQLSELISPTKVSPAKGTAQKVAREHNQTSFVDWLNAQVQSVFTHKALASVSFAMALVVFSSLLLLNDTRDNTTTYATTLGQQSEFNLDDGSKVWLNSNTRLSIKYSDDNRRIYLHGGEAFFAVNKDPNRPFEVFSDNKMVRAVGTAFSVHKRNDSVEVLVSEGIVELGLMNAAIKHEGSDEDYISKVSAETMPSANDSNADSMEILGQMIANQQVVLPNNGEANEQPLNALVLQLESEETSNELSWMDGKLVFNGETLQDVVTEITRHTAIRIDIPETQLRNIKIDGHFEAGNTESLFYVLETGFDVEVIKINDQHIELRLKKAD